MPFGRTIVFNEEFENHTLVMPVVLIFPKASMKFTCVPGGHTLEKNPHGDDSLGSSFVPGYLEGTHVMADGAREVSWWQIRKQELVSSLFISCAKGCALFQIARLACRMKSRPWVEDEGSGPSPHGIR
jgi:hypothetical protein